MSNVVEPVRYYDRHWFIRLWEIFPGALTYLTLILPIVLSIAEPVWVAYFIIAFDLYWTIKSFRLGVNLIRGYGRLHRAQTIDWPARLGWLEDPAAALADVESKVLLQLEVQPSLARFGGRSNATPWRRRKYDQLRHDESLIKQLVAHERITLDPAVLYNAVILATYNEPFDILEPSIRSLIEVDYPLNQMMLVIAYEERGGAETEANATRLIEQYGDKFAYAVAIKHPDGRVGEHRGKGANITYAGRLFTAEIERRGIDPGNVIVTTFDADHRAAKNYFSYLTYIYATDPSRLHRSYQPIPMFYNNIWDAPAPMRVIATGNSFWMLMETMRPHRLRNFAAHAQSLAALIAVDYWSITTIVEDGHQFWRSYFAFDGDHQVTPIYTPIFQDAVLAKTYVRTFQAQFLQLRRWAWGATDIQYVVRKSLENTRIGWGNKLVQLGRLIEGHFTWATAPLFLTFVGYLPLYLNHRFSYDSLSHNLPVILSRILTLGTVTYFITIGISLISLPPRPARYRRSRSIGMVLQWFLLPVTSIAFGSFAAINAQTRLMFGRYLEFYVTEKATKK